MDPSWDNASVDTASCRPGRGRWKALIGATAFLGMLGVLAGTWFVQDRHGLRTRVEARERMLAQADWAEARQALGTLATEAGAAAFYRAHPGLNRAFPDEAAFLAFAAQWRTSLTPLPEALPDAASGAYGYGGGFGMGPATLSCRLADGAWIRLRWNAPVGTRERQLVKQECWR